MSTWSPLGWRRYALCSGSYCGSNEELRDEDANRGGDLPVHCLCGLRQSECRATSSPLAHHMSWVIMHGDRNNPDVEFACQSTDPTDCVVPASRPDAVVFSDTHVYYHGASRRR